MPMPVRRRAGAPCQCLSPLVFNADTSQRREGISILSISIPVGFDRFKHLAQQSLGQLFASRAHYPVDPATTRHLRALHPGTDQVGLECCFLSIVVSEVI